jgi:hypothetical protein
VELVTDKDMFAAPVELEGFAYAHCAKLSAICVKTYRLLLPHCDIVCQQVAKPVRVH